MRKSAFSDRHVDDLKPRDKRYAHPDPEQRGHYIRVQPNGVKSYVAVARNPHRKQVWALIGGTDVLKIEEAREKARVAIRRISEGLTPFEAPATEPELFPEVAEQWLKRHVRAKGLISEPDLVRLLEGHVYPAWKRRAFVGIRRGDVTALLDKIEDDNGPRQADVVLAIVRGIFRWYESRYDDYTSPVVRGMKRQSAAKQARERILNDDELRAIWKQAEEGGTFGALVRLLLLTGQRRDKVVSMKWDDVSADGVWTIAQASGREKGTAGKLPLPEMALAIINAQPRLASNQHILAGRFDNPINGFSKAKKAFDKKLKGVAPWTLHDLRRTARSLMSRAGVSSDHAERVMGHAIGGVEGVYDRYGYVVEKEAALARLAALIESIVNPPGGNVVPISKKKTRA